MMAMMNTEGSVGGRALLLGMLLLAMVGCASCAGASSAPKRMTSLELREIQTRSFDTNDTKLVMKALIGVLQDDGFIVRNANIDLGLITADQESDLAGSSASSGHDITPVIVGLVELAVRIAAPGSSPSATTASNHDDDRWAKYKVIDCSATVSEFGTGTRVRANFQIKTIDNKGDVMGIEQVEDGGYYQEFFAKVDKGLFIAKQKL